MSSDDLGNSPQKYNTVPDPVFFTKRMTCHNQSTTRKTQPPLKQTITQHQLHMSTLSPHTTYSSSNSQNSSTITTPSQQIMLSNGNKNNKNKYFRVAPQYENRFHHRTRTALLCFISIVATTGLIATFFVSLYLFVNKFLFKHSIVTYYQNNDNDMMNQLINGDDVVVNVNVNVNQYPQTVWYMGNSVMFVVILLFNVPVSRYMSNRAMNHERELFRRKEQQQEQEHQLKETTGEKEMIEIIEAENCYDVQNNDKTSDEILTVFDETNETKIESEETSGKKKDRTWLYMNLYLGQIVLLVGFYAVSAMFLVRDWSSWSYVMEPYCARTNQIAQCFPVRFSLLFTMICSFSGILLSFLLLSLQLTAQSHMAARQLSYRLESFNSMKIETSCARRQRLVNLS